VRVVTPRTIVLTSPISLTRGLTNFFFMAEQKNSVSSNVFNDL
jgi:hypothetical protein